MPTFSRSFLATSLVLRESHHIRPVGLRRPLGGVGYLGDTGELSGGPPQLRDGIVHVLVAGIRAGCRDQRQRGRSLVVVLSFELIVDQQRL